MGTSLLQPGLLEDAALRGRGKVITRLARYGDPHRLRRVLELAGAATLSHQEPAVLLKEAEGLGDLHVDRIPGQLCPASPWHLDA
jgi:hypothetical protein